VKFPSTLSLTTSISSTDVLPKLLGPDGWTTHSLLGHARLPLQSIRPFSTIDFLPSFLLPSPARLMLSVPDVTWWKSSPAISSFLVLSSRVSFPGLPSFSLFFRGVWLFRSGGGKPCQNDPLHGFLALVCSVPCISKKTPAELRLVLEKFLQTLILFFVVYLLLFPAVPGLSLGTKLTALVMVES